MDPNANLEEQLELTKALLDQIDKRNCMPSAIDTGRLCELVIALDEWICEGGFLPESWVAARERVRAGVIEPPVE